MTETTWDAPFERLLRQNVPLLGDDEVAPDTDLLSAGLDSMGVVQLINEIEAEYEIVISDEALMDDVFATPRTLWDVVDRHRR